MRPGIEFPPLLLLQAVWLLAPGLLAGLELHRRRVISGYLVVPVAAVIGSVVGYAAVWAYFGDRRLGEVYSGVTALLGLAACVLLVLSPAHRRLLRTMDVAAPLVLLYLVALFYSSITLGCGISATITSPNEFCHISGLTGDDILPLIFANSIHHGDPHMIIWTWQQSARPPLQAGFVLMQTPLTQRPGWQNTSYLAVSILSQVLWVPALWALCRALRLSVRRVAIVLTLCLFSGFFLFNSVFTWPKLLAAALALTAFCLFFFEPAGAWTWALGGLAAAAGMLAHTGVAFVFVPMVVVLLARRHRRSWRLFVLAGAVAVAMLVPWQLYQKIYDPPGDGLMKLHVAGGLKSASDKRTFGRLLHDNYTEPSPGTIAKNKLENVTMLFGVPNRSRPLDGKGVTASLRDEEFRYTIFALGVFNLGWLVLALRRTRRRLAEVLSLDRLRLILVLAGFAMLLWVAVMYGPPQAVTVVFQNSYATMMLIFIGLGAAMTVLPRRILWPVLAVQIGYAAVIWIATVWWHHILHPGYVGLSALSGAAVLAALWALHRWAPGEPVANAGVPVDPPAVEPVPSESR